MSNQPEKFPVRGRMAKSLRKLQKPKGPAQPLPRSARLARQEKRRSFAKARRIERREQAENWNRAREIIEQDRLEAEQVQAEAQARIALEPKFDITDIMGNVVLRSVPKSMIVAQETLSAAIDDGAVRVEGSKVILPGTAEALGIEQP